MLPGRFGASIISQKWQKLDKKLQDMRAAADLVDKEIQTRGEKVPSLTVLDDSRLICQRRLLQPSAAVGFTVYTVMQHDPETNKTAGLQTFDKMSIDSRLMMEKLEAVICQIQGLSGT